MANIIIIGAGVAGLSAGIYGRIFGHEVSIYERHYKAGGNLTGWDREGYHIDNCIHWLTGTNSNTDLYNMWVELNVLGNVKIHQGETLFTFKNNNERISLYSDLNKNKQEWLKIASEDRKEIESLIKAIEVIQSIEGIGGVNNTEKSNLVEKVLSLPIILKYHNLTTKELANRFNNKLFKNFIVSIISEHFSALALIIVFATFIGKNGGIPDGGSIKMAQRMEERFLSLGGKLYLNNSVSKINLDGDRATSIVLDNGEEVKGDYIIVSGDTSVIFNKLLDKKYMPRQLVKNYNNPKMLRFSAYHCAYACDCLNLSFKGDIILQVPDKYKNIVKSEYIMIREFSHQKEYSIKDKNIIQVMVYCFEKEAKEFIKLKENKKEYVNKKNELSEVIKEIIYNELEECKDKLEVIDVWTPASYKRYIDSEIGSFMSFSFPSKTLPIKIDNRIKGIKNVILASQWLINPGGLPIAARVGKDAIETINKIESRK